MDIASLKVKVNSQEVAQADKALDRFSESSKKAAGATGTLNRELATNKNSVRGFAGAISGVLMSALGRLASIYAAIRAIRLADEFTQLRARVQLSTRSLIESAAAWRGLLDISQRTGSAVAAGISVFQRLSFVRDEIKATTQEMLQFTETVSKLGTIAGATPDALRSGLTQLGQALSSSVARAEEFNSIMENIPAVGVAIAEQLGVTTGEMRQLVINGKLLSEDVFAAILNATAKANEQFEQMPLTVSRAMGIFNATLLEFIGTLNESIGATEFLAKVIVWASDRLKEMAATVKIITSSFKAIGLAAKQAFNDVLIHFQTMYNKVAIALDKLTGGRVKPELMTSVFKTNYEDQIASLPTSQEIIREAFPERKDAEQPSTRQIATDYKKIAQSLVGSDDESKKKAEQIKKVIENLKFQNDQMKRTNEQQEIYNALRQAGVEIDSAAGRQIEELVRQHQALEKEQKAILDIIDAADRGFKSLWDNAITGAGSWRDSMSGILNDVSDMFYDMMIRDNLKGIMGGLLGGSGGGGGLFSGLSGSIGSMFSSFLPGFAEGGGFTIGPNTSVGSISGVDNRLIAFRGRDGERVSVTKPGQQMGGGNSVTYNIDARGAETGVEQRIVSALTALDRSIETRAVKAVQTSFQRDPNFGRR